MPAASAVAPAQGDDQAADQPSGIEALAYKISEAQQLMPVGKTRIYELIAAGKLESVKIGHTRLIVASSLKRILREGC